MAKEKIEPEIEEKEKISFEDSIENKRILEKYAKDTERSLGAVMRIVTKEFIEKHKLGDGE